MKNWFVAVGVLFVVTSKAMGDPQPKMVHAFLELNRDEILKRASTPIFTLAEAQKAFCERPYDAICRSGGGRVERVEREIEKERFKNEIQSSVSKALLKKLSLTEADEEKLYDIDFPPVESTAAGQNAKPRVPEKHFEEYLSALYDGVNDRARVPENFYAEMDADLDAAIKKYPGLTKSVAMQNTMSKIDMVYSSGTLQKAIAKHGKGVLEMIRLVCGKFGIADNSYFLINYPVFVVCPGAVAASVRDQSESPEEIKVRKEKAISNYNFGDMFNLYTHEKTHAIHPGGCLDRGGDETPFLHSYDPYLQCLYRRFGHPTQSADAEMPLEAFKRYGCEMVADKWSAVSSPRILKAEKDPMKRFMLVRDMLSAYCFQPGDENHPSGHYRIEAIYANDPGLREAMECPLVLACVPTGEFDPSKKPS